MVVAVLPSVGHHVALMVEVASIIHPSSTYVIPLFCVVVALFIHVGRHSLRWNAAIAAGFVLVIVASWINNLTFMVLALPFTAAALAILTVTADSWNETAWKIACIVFAIGVFSWLGIGAFLDSFTAYSHRLDSDDWPGKRSFGITTWFPFEFGEPSLRRSDSLFLSWSGALAWVGRICRADPRGDAGQSSLALAMPCRARWRWGPDLDEFGVFFARRHLALGGARLFRAGELSDLCHRCSLAHGATRYLFARAFYELHRPRAAAGARYGQHPRRYHKRGLAIAVVLAAAVSLVGTGPEILARDMVAAQVTFPPPDSPWRRVAHLVPVEKGQPFKGWFADFSATSLDYPQEVALNVQVWLSGGGTLLQCLLRAL